MKKELFLAAAVLAVPVPAAAQSAAPAVDVAIGASHPRTCEFRPNAFGISLTLSNDVPNADDRLPYSCNYIGTPVVTITSANGGLAPDTASRALGATTVDYQIAFGDDVGPRGGRFGRSASDFLAGVTSPTGPGAWTVTTAPNVRVRPRLSLHLPSPILIAGDYSDTLSITIAP